MAFGTSRQRDSRKLSNIMQGKVGRGGARWAQMGAPGQNIASNPFVPTLNKHGVGVVPIVEQTKQRMRQEKETTLDRRRKRSLEDSLRGGIISQMVSKYLEKNPLASAEEIMEHVTGQGK